MTVRGYAFGALGLAAFLAIAGAGYGVLVYPEHAAHVAVDRAIATLPSGWAGHYGSLKYSLLKRQLVLTDVTLSHDTTRLSVSQLSLSGAESGSPAGAQFQCREASMVGVTLHDDTGDVTVRSVDAIDLGADLAGISQAFAKATPGEAMLAIPHLVRAKRVAISDIHETRGPDTSGIARLVIDDFGHGVIGGLTLESLTSSSQGTEVSIAKSTLAGTDVEALQGVFDPSSYVSGQKPRSDSRQFLRTLDMRSIDVKAPTSQLHVDGVQLTGFRGRPFALAPTEANRSDPRLAADIAAALALDNGVLRGVKVSNTPTGGTAGFYNFELNGYSGGRFATAKLESFSLTTLQPQPVRAALSALELRGTDLSRWLKLIVETGPAALARSNGTIELPYAALTDLQMGAADSVTPMRIGSFTSEATYENGRATTSKASLKDLEIPLDIVKMQPAQVAMFRGMKLSRLVINVEAASRWQPDQKRLLIDGFDFGIDGLGAFNLSASIKGFDPDRFAPDTMAQALQAMTLERLELHYHDASLVDRIIAMSAAQASVAPDKMRASIIQQQEASVAQLQPDTPEAAQALQQVIEFVRHPKTLVLTFVPAQPVGLEVIQTTPPAQLVKILGLHVSAE